MQAVILTDAMLISIHALLAESDNQPGISHKHTEQFLSTLSLRRATIPLDDGSLFEVFLSTLSLRRATKHSFAKCTCNIYFYPRSPCGERPTPGHPNKSVTNFYPRSPCGERRESQPLFARPTKDFYPRSPCGERRPRQIIIVVIDRFLSTLSLRRATFQKSKKDRQNSISIHALLAESDNHAKLNIRQIQNFYPRSPCGERRISAR